MVNHVNGTNKLNSTAMDVVKNLTGQNVKDIKRELKSKLSDMLSRGEISKQEIKEVLKYADKDLMKALAAKNHVEYTKEDSNFINEKAKKLLDATGLTLEDLFKAGKLADEDYTINTVKISKEETSWIESGVQSRSELVNIQNELNAKIKANGGNRTLTEKETLQLMKGIGYADGTYKISTAKSVLAGLFPPFNIANAITSWISHGEKDLVSKIREEKPYSSQAGGGDSVINETEAKMKNLFSQGSEIPERPEIIPPESLEIPLDEE